MGISGISMPQLLILLGVVVLIFGTRKLRNIGSDLGYSLKQLRRGISDED